LYINKAKVSGAKILFGQTFFRPKFDSAKFGQVWRLELLEFDEKVITEFALFLFSFHPVIKK